MNSTAKNRIEFLDTLRFVASFAVVFQHAFERRGVAAFDLATDLLSPGVFGVVLFFFISGFVMPMSAVGAFDFRRFWARRIFRIYPLLLCAFGLIWLVHGLTGGQWFPVLTSLSLKQWIANLLLVQDYVGSPAVLGVTWTLSLELFWYLVFSVVTHFGLDPNFKKGAVLAPALMLVLVTVSFVLGKRLPLGRIGMIYAAILGARAYYLFTGAIVQKAFVRDVLVFEAVTLATNGVEFGYFRHPNITLWQAVAPWSVALAVFAAVVLSPWLRTSRMIMARPLILGGVVSYSIYLLHPIALEASDHLLGRGLDGLLLGLGLTGILAPLGYLFVERPGQGLVKQMLRRR